jgi:hypothetical protein
MSCLDCAACPRSPCQTDCLDQSAPLPCFEGKHPADHVLDGADAGVELTAGQFQMILDGIDLSLGAADPRRQAR